MDDDIDKSPLGKLLNKPREFILLFNKFTKTRKHVLESTPVYEWSPEKRKERGVLGPWAFNTQACLYAAFPSILAVKILDFLYADSISKYAFVEVDRYGQMYAEISGMVTSWFTALYFPALTTFAVLIAGWSALKKEHSTFENKVKSRAAYLYYDGTYGIVPQAIISFLVTLKVWGSSNLEFSIKLPEWMNLLWYIIIVANLLYLVILVTNRVAKMIFVANGYRGRIKHFWQKSLPNDPPLNKYQMGIMWGGVPLALVLSLIGSICSQIIIYVLIMVKSLLGGY